MPKYVVKPGDIATGVGKAIDQSRPDRFRDGTVKNDGNGTA